MKVSNRNYPILDHINSCDMPCRYYVEDKEEWHRDKDFFQQAFMDITKRLTKDSIYILSKNFIEAFEIAETKLLKSDLWSQIEECNRCYIIGKSAEVILVQIAPIHKDKKIHLGIIIFTDNTLRVCENIVVSYGFVDVAGRVSIQKGGFESKINEFDNGHYLHVLLISLFIKYAEVEIKFLPANKKVKDEKQKYVNDTNCPVTFLDSKWFTTLVKSDAFKVRGHFRLQPKKKNGEWTKELIWINDFEKSGYTAPARKLKQR